MKELLVSAPVLAYPRFGLGVEFILETDASGVSLGAVLFQTQDDEQLHPIAYASCLLDSSERNYGITELDTLAAVWAARYFCPYRSFRASYNSFYRPLSSRFCVRYGSAVWEVSTMGIKTLQDLNLTQKHRAGKLNSNANALSHNPISESKSEDDVWCCDGDRGSNSVSRSCDYRCGRCECNPGDDGRDGSSSDDTVCLGCGIYNGCGCNTGSVVPDGCC